MIECVIRVFIYSVNRESEYNSWIYDIQRGVLNMSKAEEIESYILIKIKNKEYKTDCKIPTEAQLIETFNVSRMTVNKALSSLRNKGYIYSIRGKGTFVKKQPISKKLNKLISFTEEMKSRGIEPITKTLEFAYTSVGFEEEKQSLGLDSDDNVYKIVRLRFNEEIPIALDITILNEKITGPLEFSLMKSSLYELLQETLGIKISYSIQKIKAIKADDFIANHLQVEVGEPVLNISSVTFDVNEIPIEAVHTYYRHDAYEFEQVCTM